MRKVFIIHAVAWAPGGVTTGPVRGPVSRWCGAYNANMEEQAQQLVGPIGQESKSNPGWFRAGDARINREGRPRGSKALKGDAPSTDRALQADRLMLLFVPAPDLAFRLTRQNAPWIVNLPSDAEIVGCRLDSARNGLVFTIRSAAFPRIAMGAAVPEFLPAFNGLRWRRRPNYSAHAPLD